MEKFTKHKRVEKYLDDLMRRNNFSVDALASLQSRQIVAAKQLTGIGDRTITDTLKVYKSKHGVFPVHYKQQKKIEIVKSYFKKQSCSGELTSEMIMNLEYFDLKDIPVLAGISKTTVLRVLNTLKNKYRKQRFEDCLTQFINKDKALKNTKSINEKATETCFTDEDIRLIKRMIKSFLQKRIIITEKKLLELKELKHTLCGFGVRLALLR